MPGSPSHVEEIVLTAAAESSVEVVVVDEAFRPTANAKVYSLDVDGNAVELGATARDGRLRLPVVDSDSLLFARYGGTASRLVRVASAGYAPLKLGLQPASLLSLDRPLMPEVESGLKLELVAVDASEPRQVLSIDEGGNAARPVVSGRYLVTASDSDGPRIIVAVGAEPAAPGYPAELEGERVVVDLAPKDGLWVRLRSETTGEPVSRALLRVRAWTSAASDVTILDWGVRESDSGQYFVLPETAVRDLSASNALRLEVEAPGYYRRVLTLRRDLTSTITLRARQLIGVRQVVLLGRDGLPIESVCVRDADGHEVASAKWAEPGHKVEFMWDGRVVQIGLNGTVILDVTPDQFGRHQVISVDVASLTGAMEIATEGGGAARQLRLEGLTGSSRFSPVVAGDRLVFPYLPPGGFEVVLEGTARTPVPGCPQLRDRIITAGETITVVVPEPRGARLLAGHVHVDYDRSLSVFAAPAWGEAYPLEYSASMAVPVRVDGAFEFANVPFPPTHVVFFRYGEALYERVVLGVEPWNIAGQEYRISLGDFYVQIEVAGGEAGAVRVGARHEELANRLVEPCTHWKSRDGAGRVAFRAVPVGLVDVVVPPHSGGAPARVVVSRTGAPTLPMVFRSR